MSTEQATRPAIPGTFSLLAKTFSVYRSNFSLFFGFSAWLLVPLVVSLLAFISFDKDVADLVDFFFNIILYAVLVSWLTVVFISLVPSLRKNHRINPASIGTDAWYLLVPFLIVSLVVGLVNLAGFALFIVPGLVLSTLLAFSAIIAVLEKAKLSEAMRQSFDMVKPRFFKVFIRLFGGMLILVAFYLLAMFGVEVLDALINQTNLQTAFFSAPTMLDETLYRFVEIIVLPLVTIYQTLLYLALRKVHRHSLSS